MSREAFQSVNIICNQIPLVSEHTQAQAFQNFLKKTYLTTLGIDNYFFLASADYQWRPSEKAAGLLQWHVSRVSSLLHGRQLWCYWYFDARLANLPTLLPNTLTSVWGKIFEWLQCQWFIAWGRQRCLFYSDHFGFLTMKECTTALRALFKDILKTQSQHKFAIAAYLSIKAAYDSICPHIFIYKLTFMGICGKTGNFIENFLHSCHIQTLWNPIWSTFRYCLHSVPQESTLLFRLYLMNIAETQVEEVHKIL